MRQNEFDFIFRANLNVYENSNWKKNGKKWFEMSWKTKSDNKKKQEQMGYNNKSEITPVLVKNKCLLNYLIRF